MDFNFEVGEVTQMDSLTRARDEKEVAQQRKRRK